MVMMMFMSCYTIVDGIFISRYLGSEALSAANIVYPVFNLLQEEVPLSVKNLGRGKKKRPWRTSRFSLQSEWRSVYF